MRTRKPGHQGWRGVTGQGLEVPVSGRQGVLALGQASVGGWVCREEEVAGGGGWWFKLLRLTRGQKGSCTLIRIKVQGR